MKKTANNPLSVIRNGDLCVRLSCLIMGAGCLLSGQIGKGLIYLGFQALSILYFFGFGWQYLSHIGTLGENAQRKVWDESLQIYKRVPGDNSMLILLFSVLTIAVIALYLWVWYLNLKSAAKAREAIRAGKKPAPFREDLRTLLDERFHVTLLSAPMLSLAAFTVLPIIFMILIAFTNFDSTHQPRATCLPGRDFRT